LEQLLAKENKNMMLRSFIALEIPPRIQQVITRASASLQKSLPRPLVRWVSPQNIHLTIRFLGEISSAILDQVVAALEFEASNHATIEVQVENFGAFPNSERARVLWVGLQAPSALSDLHKSVETITTNLGFTNKESGFSPHLTIGRVNQNATYADLKKISSCLHQMETGVLGCFQVEAIAIFKSNLRPSGPLYTLLHSIPLGQ
jgi:2'-5' RNA ligase